MTKNAERPRTFAANDERAEKLERPEESKRRLRTGVKAGPPPGDPTCDFA